METDATAQSSSDQRLDKWMSLMSTDLQMKITSQDETVSNRKPCEIGDVLNIEFEGWQAKNRDDVAGPKFQDVKDWLVRIGDKDTTPALEMGLRFMMDGETSLIYSDRKFAYGVAGRNQGDFVLQSNANVLYRVHIKRLVPADSELSHTPSFKMELACGKKAIGNDCFQFEWSNGIGKGKSLMLYKNAADAMTNLIQETEDEVVRQKALAILVDCLNNTAAVYLKAKEYGKAKDAATKVILRDPDNIKALLRAARAALHDPAGTFEESAAAIAAAEQVDPNDADLRKLKMEYGKRRREYKDKEKMMLSKMSAAIVSPKSTAGCDEGIAIQSTTIQQEATTIDQRSAPGMETIEKRRFRKYLPHILQLVLPWIAYLVFWWLKRDSGVDKR